MAFSTEGYQVLLAIGPQMTAELDVMDLQLDHGTAQLASPAVPL